MPKGTPVSGLHSLELTLTWKWTSWPRQEDQWSSTDQTGELHVTMLVPGRNCSSPGSTGRTAPRNDGTVNSAGSSGVPSRTGLAPTPGWQRSAGTAGTKVRHLRGEELPRASRGVGHMWATCRPLVHPNAFLRWAKEILIPHLFAWCLASF